MADFISDADMSQIQTAPSPEQPQASADFIPDKEFVSDEDKANSPGEIAKAALHGAGKGLLGHLGPHLEKRLLHQTPEEMRTLEEQHPIATGLGELGGFGIGAVTGTGLAGAVGEAGEVAQGLTKAGEAANAAREAASGMGLSAKTVDAAGKAAMSSQPLLARVGSSAARNAAEMAVMQGSDEVAKQIMQDPTASSESAISNIGLASALGGAGGAFFTGAVSPLWKATAGPAIDTMMSGLKAVTDRNAVALPEVVENAFKTVGTEPSPVMRAALSGDPKAQQAAQDLYRAQNPGFMDELKAIPNELHEKVANSLGIPLEDAANFSNREDGEKLRDKFTDIMADKFEGPIEQIKQRNEEAKFISPIDEDKRDLGNRMMETAIDAVGTDSPYYKEWEHYAQRAMAQNDVRGLDRLSSEMYKKMKTFGIDGNLKDSLYKMRGMIDDFKEQQIEKAGERLAQESGNPEAASAMIEQRKGANAAYRTAAKEAEDIMGELGLGDWKGEGNFRSKFDDLTAEKIVRKFSTKGNARFQELMLERHPELAELVRQHEAKSFLAPAIKDVAGEKTLDYKKLAKKLEELKKGSPEYANFILPKQAQDTIQSAKTIEDAISQIKAIKDSGTPAGLGKVFKHVGAGAVGTIGFLMGHNPIASALIGEMGQRLAKDAPEAIKLGWLKFLGSDKPVNAEGFKAMVDFIDAAYKGNNTVTKGVENVFKREAQVIPLKLMPTPKELTKIDKLVADNDGEQNRMNDRLVNAPNVHYMEDHHTATASAITGITGYLKTIKPQGFKPGPLDKEIPPSKSEMARYNRALEIAQQPAIVLQKIKNGTLQVNDIKDLSNMYPALYSKMQQQLLQQAANIEHNGGTVPYKTRMSMSLFMSEPLDATMQPQSIIAAQPKPQQQPQQPQQNSTKGKPSAMKAKSTNIYQTPGQQAEKDRASRD